MFDLGWKLPWRLKFFVGICVPNKNWYHTIPHHTTIYHTTPPHTYPITRAPQLSVDRPKQNFRSSRGGPIQAKRDFRQMAYHTIPHQTTPNHTVPHHTIPYHTIPYHTIPYGMIGHLKTLIWTSKSKLFEIISKTWRPRSRIWVQIQDLEVQIQAF